MSDQFVHAFKGCDETSGQSLRSYHSVWMSHWTRKSCEEIVQNHNCSSSSFINKDSCRTAKGYQPTRGKEIVSSVYEPAEGLGEIQNGSLKIKNECLQMTSTAKGTETPAFRSSPTDCPCNNGESSSPVKDGDIEAAGAHQVYRNLGSDSTTLTPRGYMPPQLSMAPDANRTPLKEYRFETEGILYSTKEHVETCSFFGDSSFAMLRPLAKDMNKSTTDMVQRGLGHGNQRISSLPLLLHRTAPASEEQLPHTNSSSVDNESLNLQRHSAFVYCEEKIESRSRSGRLTSYQQQNIASSFEKDFFPVNNGLPVSGQEQFQKKHSVSGIRIFQNGSGFPEATTSDKLYHGRSSLHTFPQSLQDPESMRVCTTTDSVGPLHGGHPRFSQTAKSLLIPKRTDLNSWKAKVPFGNIRGLSEFNGNPFTQLRSLAPSFGHGCQGVKIQSLGSSTDSEGKEKVGDDNPLGRFDDSKDLMASDYCVDSRGKKVQDDSDLKNESSAETDTMELGDFREKNQLSSVNSSPSSKDLKTSPVIPQLTIACTGKAACSKFSGINLELPALPASDNVNTNSSRTQSLDMDRVLAHTERLSHSESDRCHEDSAMPEPTSRWIKRLKLSASEPFGFGTKSSNMEERSHLEKDNLSLGRNLEGSRASSEQTVSKLLGKELMVTYKTAPCGESSSTGTAENGKDAPASLPWIRRWCHNQSATPKKKPETVVFCEPQRSELAFEELQGRQFPSIGAMALMGKAMSGFQPCEIERKGSLMLWNIRRD